MAAAGKPNQMVWWIANSDKNVRRGYRAVKAQLPRLLLTHDPPSEGANDRILRFQNGSQIEFYTAGTPDALAGEGVDFVVVDEAALIPENVWFQLLRPTLADTKGRALIISTPRGRNWFHTVWMRGQGDNKHVQVLALHLDRLAVHRRGGDRGRPADAARPDLPRRSTWPSSSPTPRPCSSWTARARCCRAWSRPEGWVYMGVDLAKKEDFTVISASNADTRLPCYYDRWNDVSWAIQEDYIMNAVRSWRPTRTVEGVTVGVDSTGLGDVVFDSLDERGLDVVPVNFASGNIKERMVRQLSADLEHGRAHIIEDMRDEFEAYEYNITPQGRYKFEAATGHDDKVSAKLIENWIAVHEGAPGIRCTTRPGRPRGRSWCLPRCAGWSSRRPRRHHVESRRLGLEDLAEQPHREQDQDDEDDRVYGVMTSPA
jgi:hypothetical protein